MIKESDKNRKIRSGEMA